MPDPCARLGESLLNFQYVFLGIHSIKTGDKNTLTVIQVVGYLVSSECPDVCFHSQIIFGGTDSREP